jgi:hypothetical protein
MESIEKSVFNKLALVKDILLDSVDEAKSKDIVRMLERKD